MARQALLLLCASALLVGICASGDLQGRGSLLLWSNAAIVGDGHGPKVMYQVLDNVQDATAQAVIGLVNNQQSASELLHATEAASAVPIATIIFAGSQLGAEELRRGGASRLDLVLGAAASSLVVPHASGQTSPQGLQDRLAAAGLRVKAIGCQRSSDDLVRDVVDALGAAEQPQVLLVCPAAADPASLTQQAALDQELDQLLAVQEAVDALGVRHLFIYASHKASGMQRRSLATVVQPLTGFGNYSTCGQLCVTQTRWLEGMLALLFLALASCAGMTCLNVLNTPTRFEVVKEGSTQ